MPLDSGGTVGENGSLVYTLDSSGAPQLVVADGPGGRVFIDPSTNELVSIEFDQSCSSMNCAAGLIRTGYTLVSGVLQQQDTCEFLPSSADQDPPQGTCTPPESVGASSPAGPTPTAGHSGPDLNVLKGFAGAVLILPLDQPPYAGWTLQNVSVSVVKAGPDSGTPFYNEKLHVPQQSIFSGAQINGYVGRIVQKGRRAAASHPKYRRSLPFRRHVAFSQQPPGTRTDQQRTVSPVVHKVQIKPTALDRDVGDAERERGVSPRQPAKPEVGFAAEPDTTGGPLR